MTVMALDADLGITPASIQAVQVTICARKDDAASREVHCKLKSGAATVDGVSHALAASYVYYRDIFETDPDTAAAWTSAGVHATQIGPEVVALWPRAASPRSSRRF